MIVTDVAASPRPLLSVEGAHNGSMKRERSAAVDGSLGRSAAPRRYQSAFKSGTPARVHHNPFDDVLEQIDRAAEVLQPDRDALEPLRHARRQVGVSLPVMMDDGHLQMFEG